MFIEQKDLIWFVSTQPYHASMQHTSHVHNHSFLGFTYQWNLSLNLKFLKSIQHLHIRFFGVFYTLFLFLKNLIYSLKVFLYWSSSLILSTRHFWITSLNLLGALGADFLSDLIWIIVFLSLYLQMKFGSLFQMRTIVCTK